MAETTVTSKPTNKWAERLRGRSRMAVAVIGGVFMVGFLGVSRPLSQRIDGANDRLAKAEARAHLAGEVSELRRQASLYSKKLPRVVDPNDWTDYLLQGIRTENVKLTRMEPREPLRLGPCKVLTWHIEMEGSLESIGRIVEWMENSNRLLRIDRLVLDSPHGGSIGAALVIRGLALDGNESAQQKAKPARDPVPTVQIKQTDEHK
jgi:hypothetical protein